MKLIPPRPGEGYQIWMKDTLPIFIEDKSRVLDLEKHTRTNLFPPVIRRPWYYQMWIFIKKLCLLAKW